MRLVRTRLAKRATGDRRTLHLEPLEDRRLLAGSPWHNPTYRLDVTNDGAVTTSDALAIINRILTQGAGDLGEPTGPVTSFYDTNDDGRIMPSDLHAIINGINSPPQVEISMLTPYTIDVTPIITVNATARGSVATIPDGTAIALDVDLDNNGLFDGPGERDYTASETFNGSATFQITPALERRTEVYNVNLRARLKDSDAVAGGSAAVPMVVDTLTSDALSNYVNTPDAVYDYSVALEQDQDGFTYYVLDMTSQTWRSSADVNKPDWRHWVKVFVPDGAVGDTALMYISGGSNSFGSPPGFNPNNADDVALAEMAIATGTVTYQLRGVPSEPLEFVGDDFGPRSEDEIIAYSFAQYLEHIGEEGNETWPVLVAMAKSAVRAMDSVQDFIPQIRPDDTIDDFVVTGYSKRGWTTWLTGAVDPRVKAIIPGVFDNLNQAPQMVHHYGVYGFFSEAVHDYLDERIFERILTPEAELLSRIVDPYRYLGTGKFDDMPILALHSAGDEFFVTDSSQFYINDLPGDDKYQRYIPNTRHSLDIRAAESTLSFYAAVLLGSPLPDFTWEVKQNGEIHVHADTAPTAVKLWQETNPNARDFRNNPLINPTPVDTWSATVLTSDGAGNYVGDVPMPANGATAYFVELTFPGSVPGLPAHVFTTEARVKSMLPFTEWPYESGFPLDESDEVFLSLGGAVDIVAEAAVAAAPLNEPSAAVAFGLEAARQLQESPAAGPSATLDTVLAVEEAPQASAASETPPLVDGATSGIELAGEDEFDNVLELELNDLPG